MDTLVGDGCSGGGRADDIAGKDGSGVLRVDQEGEVISDVVSDAEEASGTFLRVGEGFRSIEEIHLFPEEEEEVFGDIMGISIAFCQRDLPTEAFVGAYVMDISKIFVSVILGGRGGTLVVK